MGRRGGTAPAPPNFMPSQFQEDLGQLEFLTDQVDRVRSKVRGFSITMSDIIAWKDLEGLHGIATGDINKVKVDWSYVEMLLFFVVWSHKVGLASRKNNVSLMWTPGKFG